MRRRSLELNVEKETKALSRAADINAPKNGSALPQGSQSMKSNTRRRRKVAALAASWHITAALLLVLRLVAAVVQARKSASEAMQ